MKISNCHNYPICKPYFSAKLKPNCIVKLSDNYTKVAENSTIKSDSTCKNFLYESKKAQALTPQEVEYYIKKYLDWIKSSDEY